MSAHVEKYRRHLKNLPARGEKPAPVNNKSNFTQVEPVINIGTRNIQPNPLPVEPVINVGNRSGHIAQPTKYQGCLGCAGGRIF